MISIPLDTKDATTISKLYGNAPFFALLDDVNGSFTVVENKECGNGPKIPAYLTSLGASTAVFEHMGDTMFKIYMKNSTKVFTCKDKSVSIDEIYQEYLNGTLLLIDENNYKQFTDECSCTCKA